MFTLEAWELPRAPADFDITSINACCRHQMHASLYAPLVAAEYGSVRPKLYGVTLGEIECIMHRVLNRRNYRIVNIIREAIRELTAIW